MNIWKQFQQLLPSDPQLVGEVLRHNADGSSSVELPGAQVIRVQGQSVAAGLRAFVQGGRIQGEAPDLPTYELPI
ncbi:hypothetical protein D0B54_02350 [Solimonas sp. K1W22B-7]|uniref:hypothetical protein n=1 Tax=Solimonas sp. K1W22B-7 TaxID=2303331 RepID=UPI000E32D88A|nr:hypothetical protein [Solimonas sp. K1W22B-7]AXQ27582.1 hypothetical protein D0B54_02350 [Solimonas sp. K1W22B-7]